MTDVADEFYELAKDICSKTIPNYILLDKTRLRYHDSTLQDVVDSWVNCRIPGFAKQMREFIETKVRPKYPPQADSCLRHVDGHFVAEMTREARRIPRREDWTEAPHRYFTLDKLGFGFVCDKFLERLRETLWIRETPKEKDLRSDWAQQTDMTTTQAFLWDYAHAPYEEIPRWTQAERDEKAAHERAKKEWAERRQREEEEKEAKKKLSGGGGFRSAYRVSFF